MLNKIKNNVENELRRYAADFPRLHRLNGVSPLLTGSLRDFILRPGKRIRPVLLVFGYRAFSRRQPAGLLRSALSIELLHDFMLIHDDIIDRSATRRGRPSMHASFNTLLKRFARPKFNGQDLAIVAADTLYAMAMAAFLEVREDPQRKEKALRQFIHAALYTGAGEFTELICSARPLARVTLEDIYAIYDYKTALYTFAYPLSIGATLGGARPEQSQALFDYGKLIGRAFQIKDDILGVFGDQRRIGKSTVSDIREAKKTILVWHAYRRAGRDGKRMLRNIFLKTTVGAADVAAVKRLMRETGAQAFAQREILRLRDRALGELTAAGMSSRWSDELKNLTRQILS